MFFGHGRRGGGAEGVAGVEHHLCAFFDHLLSRHRSVLGFRAGIGFDDPQVVAVDAALGVGFSDELLHSGDAGVIGRVNAGLGDRRADHDFLGQAGGADRFTGVAAAGESEQREEHGWDRYESRSS